MEKVRFRESETKKYAQAINTIRDDMADGRDFWAALYSQGFTFTEDIDRFACYAELVKADDILKPILLNRLKEIE